MKDEEALKRLLAAGIPPADPDGQARTLQMLRTLPPRQPIGMGRFLLTQAGFIRKRMWALQLAFLAGVVLLVQKNLQMSEPPLHTAWQLSAAMPLLILINVTDLARIYNGSMLEIELATRFSLPKVTTARLLLFGLSDAGVVLLASAFAASATRIGLWRMLLYCLVPFDLMCLGCLQLLRCVKPDHFTVYAAILAAVLVALPVMEHVRLYKRLAPTAWAAAALVLTLALVWQTGAFLRGLRPGGGLLAQLYHQ